MPISYISLFVIAYEVPLVNKTCRKLLNFQHIGYIHCLHNIYTALHASALSFRCCGDPTILRVGARAKYINDRQFAHGNIDVFSLLSSLRLPYRKESWDTIPKTLKLCISLQVQFATF
jgi:hypothetical protein